MIALKPTYESALRDRHRDMMTECVECWYLSSVAKAQGGWNKVTSRVSREHILADHEPEG